MRVGTGGSIWLVMFSTCIWEDGGYPVGIWGEKRRAVAQVDRLNGEVEGEPSQAAALYRMNLNEEGGELVHVPCPGASASHGRKGKR